MKRKGKRDNNRGAERKELRKNDDKDAKGVQTAHCISSDLLCMIGLLSNVLRNNRKQAI